MRSLTIILVLLLLSFNLEAQTSEYENLWKRVEKLELDQLPKSALKLVNEISEKANKEENSSQQIKVLLFKSKFSSILEEDSQLKIVNEFKVAIETSDAPAKQVLQNMLAKIYWDYFRGNRYKYYNRTKTSTLVDTTDFRTWDVNTLFSEIGKTYLNSLDNAELLKNTPLDDFESILVRFPESKTYRPTLYDLLSHNALNFFTTDENSITRPTFKFEVTDPEYLENIERFIALELKSEDSSSLQLQALYLYQDLLKFHTKNKNSLALADLNISRLKFVYQNGKFPEKNDLYLDALNGAILNARHDYAKVMYKFEVADQYYTLGASYQPISDTLHRWKRKAALELCDEIMSSFSDSKAGKNARSLKSAILQKELSLTSESYVPLHTESRIRVEYRNYEELNFNIYKLSVSQRKAFNKIRKEKERIEFIKKLKPIENWNITLKNEGDYQLHTTEVAIPALDNGDYIVVAKPVVKTNSEDIKTSQNFFAYSDLQVSDIALLESNDEDFTYFQIIDRNNGKPLPGARCLTNRYDLNRKNVVTETHITDINGMVRIQPNSSIQNRDIISTTVIYKDDKVQFGRSYHYSGYYGEKEEEEEYRSFLFTDRSIYRPGQTIYFKGIVVKGKEGATKVAPNEPVYVALYDANDDDLGELELTTNEFGSVSGSFKIPMGRVTGSYYLELESESNDPDVDFFSEFYFKVEEYKRPKFEAVFQPVTGSYRLDDSISVTGEAKAFAGSLISNAKVVYTVKRIEKRPRWYAYGFYDNPNHEPQEIDFGETTTDSEGKFSITFKAIPDLKVEKSTFPVFIYLLEADITDINGETQSTSTEIKVGYHTLLSKILIPEKLNKRKKGNLFEISTENLNNQFVAAEVSVAIYKLDPPQRLLRTRPWIAPDYQNWTEAEFIQKFPHDAYGNESELHLWKTGEKFFDKNFNTANLKKVELGNIKKWPSGAYKIISTVTDEFGQEIEETSLFNLYSPKDDAPADMNVFTIQRDKLNYHPGETVKLTLGSAASINVTVSVERKDRIENTYVVSLNNDKKSINIPVYEKDKGAFTIHYSYAAFNSLYSNSMIVPVEQGNDKLFIETASFRDKLVPGDQETWSFTIKGSNYEKVSAELLASMYDVSLDKFNEHSWNLTTSEERYRNFNGRPNGRLSFGTERFMYNGYSYPYGFNRTNNNYDHFNWFGFHVNGWYYSSYLYSIRRQINSSYSGTVKEGWIRGTIYNSEGLPLPGVSVIVKGTTNGTQTDFDGNFSIEADPSDVLVFSYLGYSDKEITINNKNIYSVELDQDNASLDEVVVTGYGVSKEKQSMAYSVSAVVAANQGIEQVDGLLGTLPGVAGNAEMNLSYTDSIAYNSATRKALLLNTVKVRKNLQETAFFFPHLRTDNKGNITFSFTSPEALTRWKLQLFAHTRDMEYQFKTLEAVTQKDLMILPNAPRFLREEDRIVISTKISNITSKSLSGDVILQLEDALTGEPVDADFSNSNSLKTFSISALGNSEVSWELKIPQDIEAAQYKIIAKAGEFSDGEQSVLPVLSNRMLVTESIPMWVRNGETRTFTLQKLKNTNSKTLENHKVTLEITSNPAWYAIQALPYLMEYPYECNEQIFSRYYANSLATHIANSNPKIKSVFEQWDEKEVLLSNLEKNQELKSLLIQETPWLRDAQSEKEQMKRLGMLFNLSKMADEQLNAVNVLQQNQLGNGAWSWFKGGVSSRYITQHIAIGFGHLNKLGVATTHYQTDNMLKKAVSYLDDRFVKEYEDLNRYDNVDYNANHLSHNQLHYLYMRSFFPKIKEEKKVQEIKDYYLKQIQEYWNVSTLYSKGLMALIAHRNGDNVTADKIIRSLKETSIESDELGMYWKSNTSSWFWYRAPIETQALLIEVFSEVTNDTATVDAMKVWLLKNKQTNRWPTTKATTDAVYAILLQGSEFLAINEQVDVSLGPKKVPLEGLEELPIEAGTGYFKTHWMKEEVTSELAEITLTKNDKGIAWGGLYWQYFEDLDKITSAETPLQLRKKLFLKSNTSYGKEITEINEHSELKVGDLIRVRIELEVDRPMEYVHMKDMRAAGLEPVNVLSEYKWQGGLGYYEATKDASTNFFFERLPKGIYVFEYDLRVNNAGDFSNGITTVQCMYAPEFTSHSEGIRIKIDQD